jgi:hypothetical protein
MEYTAHRQDVESISGNMNWLITNVPVYFILDRDYIHSYLLHDSTAWSI